MTWERVDGGYSLRTAIEKGVKRVGTNRGNTRSCNLCGSRWLIFCTVIVKKPVVNWELSNVLTIF